ncbi:hypothetical protein AAFF_G00138130 [Aldrovandia affinis]|uniref:Uncharacterized protein n=1 Tax=Aldrovandia affinis TaxID=143900 RepID=A0AAD7TBW9_9TELE|nr:hypothetical protein AAFF_G00138130 [Aldrovandia affinis]
MWSGAPRCHLRPAHPRSHETPVAGPPGVNPHKLSEWLHVCTGESGGECQALEWLPLGVGMALLRITSSFSSPPFQTQAC